MNSLSILHLNRWIFILLHFFLLCMAIADENPSKTVLLSYDQPFYLVPEIDETTAQMITRSTDKNQMQIRKNMDAFNKKNKKKDAFPVILWIMGIENLEDPFAFIETLPPNIGILLNPYNLLNDDILNLLKLKKDKDGLINPLGLMVPTRTRVDGRRDISGTLNSNASSTAFIQEVIQKHNIKVIFLPHSIDLDLSVLPQIDNLAKTHGLRVLLVPQLFGTLVSHFSNEKITVDVIHSYFPADKTAAEFFLLLRESMMVLDNIQTIHMVIALNSLSHETFQKLLKTIDTHHGYFARADHEIILPDFFFVKKKEGK